MTPPRATDAGYNEPTIAATREGTGPEVLFVHGGASPAKTWSGLEHLSERWTLVFAYRRGYAPSPAPPGGRQDFEVDAADISKLLDDRPHLVAHSYGAVAAVIAATQRPAQVRSLTLIEPPIFLPPDDPDVARFERMSKAVLAHGLHAEPATLREFLKVTGATVLDEGPLPQGVIRGVQRAHGSRHPGEARLALHSFREAGIPALVASGDHCPAIERMCDATAAALNARRVIAPGAGHFVAAATGFAGQLEQFLISTG